MTRPPRRSRRAAKPRRDTRDARPTVAGVGISNGGRIVYPDPSLTKLDVARYYERIADWVVAGRPLTLVRCPEGIRGGCFFMKHSKVWAPEPKCRQKLTIQRIRAVRG